MKKGVLVVTIILLVCGGFITYFMIKNSIERKQTEKELARIKKGWYVEVINDTLPVREGPTPNAKQVATAYKGEIFKVVDFEETETIFFWYKIIMPDKTEGFVGNPKAITVDKYLKDHNNPNDISRPRLAFDEDVYHVENIDAINYKHLRLWDDRDEYEVTHKVYHEVKESENIDQYWIKYTITDAAGKSSSKTQKIEFDTRPDESRVLEFYANYWDDEDDE